MTDEVGGLLALDGIDFDPKGSAETFGVEGVQEGATETGTDVDEDAILSQAAVRAHGPVHVARAALRGWG